VRLTRASEGLLPGCLSPEATLGGTHPLARGVLRANGAARLGAECNQVPANADTGDRTNHATISQSRTSRDLSDRFAVGFGPGAMSQNYWRDTFLEQRLLDRRREPDFVLDAAGMWARPTGRRANPGVARNTWGSDVVNPAQTAGLAERHLTFSLQSRYVLLTYRN
jgi:hypothetical protein